MYFKDSIKKTKTEPKKTTLCAAIILLFLIGIISFFDKGLAVGLLLVCLLTTATFFVLFKLGIKDKELYLLLPIVFLMHLFIVLVIHFTGFNPFGGGADFEGYNQTAIQIAQRFNHGNFSLKGIALLHYFPVLIGIVYAITLPEIIVGQLFGVWLAVFSVLLFYLLSLEIGASKKSAFLMGVIVSFYPSYLYFGSLLLKDTVVMPLILAGLLLSVKMIKNFTALKFLLFFAVLTCAIHLRFYVGFALMFSFIICWFSISNLKAGERIIYGLTIVFILGLSPLLLGYGYYGSIPLFGYLNKNTIKTYREVVYAPPPETVSVSAVTKPATNDCSTGTSCTVAISNKNATVSAVPEKTVGSAVPAAVPAPVVNPISEDSGTGSSFVIKAGFENPFTFVTNYTASFLSSLFGPFPWQLRYKRHLFFLLETIPWYLLFCLAVYGIYKFIKAKGFLQFLKHYKFALPLFLFVIMALGALSLFIDNYGIIVRIRMPMLVSLLCIFSLCFDFENKYLQKFIHRFL